MLRLFLLALELAYRPLRPKVLTREVEEDDVGMRLWRSGRALGDKRGIRA